MTRNDSIKRDSVLDVRDLTAVQYVDAMDDETLRRGRAEENQAIRLPTGPVVMSIADVPPSPWRNGGGLTRVLATNGEPGDEWWRLSVADIHASGPFSTFPGWTRHFCLIDTGLLTLRIADTSHPVRPEEPITFDGAATVTATLAGSPTRALNLMVRTGAHVGGLAVDSFDGLRSYGDDVVALVPIRGRLHHEGRAVGIGAAILAGKGRIHVRGHEATAIIATAIPH